MLGAAGADCDTACGTDAKVCSPEALEAFNTQARSGRVEVDVEWRSSWKGGGQVAFNL